MVEILVIFGSKSNSNVFEPILDHLKKNDVSYNFRICSAHRTPNLLDEILLETNAKVIIAGAGLAAHLPGVIASKTVKPVIGIPCSDNFAGLDAFLAIVQMPPGIPVISVGVDAALEAAKAAILMLKDYEKVNIVSDDNTDKAKKVLKSFEINFTHTDSFDENALNIQLALEPKSVPDNVLCLNILIRSESAAEDAASFMDKTVNGLWLGLNRQDNAAIAAVQIIGKHKELEEQRLEKEKSVLADDEKLRVI